MGMHAAKMVVQVRWPLRRNRDSARKRDRQTRLARRDAEAPRRSGDAPGLAIAVLRVLLYWGNACFDGDAHATYRATWSHAGPFPRPAADPDGGETHFWLRNIKPHGSRKFLSSAGGRGGARKCDGRTLFDGFETDDERAAGVRELFAGVSAAGLSRAITAGYGGRRNSGDRQARAGHRRGVPANERKRLSHRAGRLSG